MKIKSGFIAIIAALFCAFTAFATDYSTWARSKTIAINPSGLGLTAAVVNVPVLIRLTSSANSDIFTGSLSTGGADIRFTQPDGTTDLSYQIESWNSTNKTASIWVMVPSVASSANTSVKMYWGKSGQTTTSSGSAVFSTTNGFQALFHMNEVVNDTIRDATANGFKGVPVNRGGANPKDTIGVIGRAKSFLGGNANNNGGSYRLVTSTGANTQNGKLNFQNDSANTYTISAWIYADNFPTGTTTRKAIIAKSKGTNGSQYHLRALDPSVDQINPANDTNRIDFADGPSAVYKSGTTKLTTGAWYHVVAVRNGPAGVGANLAVYVNGGNVFNSTNNLTQTTASAYSVYIGSYSNDSGYFGGRIDEVSFSNSARDLNWIKLSYATEKPGATALLMGPSSLTYSTNPATYPLGTAITANTPTVYGDAVTGYTVSPTLPTGLSLNASTGIISGTPTVAKAATVYTITATNAAGSTTASVTITAGSSAPSALSYSANPATYGVSKIITNNTPTVTGTVTSWSISPALSSGLAFSTSTGILSGTPTVAKVATNYTVTATNASGSTTATLNITVLAAPTALTYTKNPLIAGVAKAITPDTAKVTGTVTTYTVSPTLPTGMTLNSTKGIITGTPTAAKAASNYTVTATNVAGSTTVSLSITVLAAPTALTYTKNPLIAGVAKAITPDTAKVTGTVTTYTVSPTLPTGMTLNSTKGIITGTPTAAKAASNYTVTATNVAGSTTVSLSITVLAAPTALTYTKNPLIAGVAKAITPDTAKVTGTVTTYTVSPTLPTGLALSASTGIITGTPTAAKAASNYTVTATNVAGSTTVSLSITVLAVPSALSYVRNPVSFVLNTTITNDTAKVTGTVTSWSISPALSTGLAFSTTTGIVSGRPTVTKAATNYTVTATNVAGSATVVLKITVTATALQGVTPIALLKHPETFVLRFSGSSSIHFPFPVGGVEEVQITLMDMSGRKVGSNSLSLGNGSNELAWNGMSSSGLPLTKGTYLAHVVILNGSGRLANILNTKINYTP